MCTIKTKVDINISNASVQYVQCVKLNVCIKFSFLLFAYTQHKQNDREIITLFGLYLVFHEITHRTHKFYSTKTKTSEEKNRRKHKQKISKTNENT